MNIQFSDLRAQYEFAKEQIDYAIQRVLSDGNYILGKQVSDLEQNFSEYSGYKYGIGVSSGTAAIELLLRSVVKNKDSEIILPANTFIASCIGAMEAGFKVKLADVDYDTQLITQETVAECITSDSWVVMGVDLFGQKVDESVWKYAEGMNCIYVNDACQSHGVKIVNQHPSCFSFYPAKNFGGIGDGGMILLNEEWRYKELLKMRNYGSTVKYVHDSYGQNERLDTINAAVLNAKLPYLNAWNEKRVEVAKLYSELLHQIGDIVCPTINPQSDHVFHLFVIKTQYRDKLQKYLVEHDVPVQIHYPIPIHKQKVYQNYNFGSNNLFPVTERLANEILSLPIHPFITESEIEYVVETIHNFFSNSSHKSQGWWE